MPDQDVTVAIAAILLPFAAITGFFVVEILAGLPRLRAKAQPTRSASATIIVPAHDEEAIIGDTLAALIAAAGDARILVVADNCADDTAAVARMAGVEVIERRVPEEKGKGFALAFATQHLRSDPPQIVVVLDADCETDADGIARLVATAASTERPCQAVNLLRPDRSRSALVQLSTFAFLMKNLVRQRGLQRLAGRVHLTGTGMAMPWTLFESAKLGNASVVEDLKLGMELAAGGHPPRLVQDAFVWSGASSNAGTLVQRRRWEGGFIATSLQTAPRQLLRSLAKGDVRGVCAALDLLVPPLALLALLNGAALAGAAMINWFTAAAWWPIAVHLLIVALAGLAILAAWWREGRAYISFGALLRLPLYVLWKLPMYLSFGRSGAPRDWLRTGR